MHTECFRAKTWHSCFQAKAGPWLVWLALTAVAFAVVGAEAAAESPFRKGKCEQGELRFVGDLPVLIVEGTPADIGRQKAALTGEVVKTIVDYPHRLLAMIGREDRWATFLELGKKLEAQFPADHMAELHAFTEATGIDHDLSIVGNTMTDTYRGGFACSSLLVAADRSHTGGPLFGRNLDFYTLSLLDDCALVTIYRPKGKHAFAAIGYPGILGVVSGMNDAGLAIAVHEVFMACDGSSMLNTGGMPYTLAFRRILEECTTVGEAEKLLRQIPRTTMLSLAVCDPKDGAVIELTPKTVAVRRGAKGICPCTNHFRAKEVASLAWCSRYNALAKAEAIDKLDIASVAKKLDEANQGTLTVQSMIFEPAALRLHLAVGKAPSSAEPYKVIDLKPLFEPSPADNPQYRTAADAAGQPPRK